MLKVPKVEDSWEILWWDKISTVPLLYTYGCNSDIFTTKFHFFIFVYDASRISWNLQSLDYFNITAPQKLAYLEKTTGIQYTLSRMIVDTITTNCKLTSLCSRSTSFLRKWNHSRKLYDVYSFRYLWFQMRKGCL